MHPSPTPSLPIWTALQRRLLSRRALLRAGGRAGVASAGLALVGCGGDDDDAETPDAQADAQAQTDAQAADDQDGTQSDSGTASDADSTGLDQAAAGDARTQTATPTPGGIAQIFAVTDEHDRWDPHRSRFRATQSFLSLMYSRLLRPDSLSQGTLEADLAGLPETPDDSTYIFQLNPSAVFWEGPPADGRAVDSEDVRLSIQRQIDGANTGGDPDLRFYRQSLMARVAAMETPDDFTITLHTAEPDATFLSTLVAGPWSFIISREAIDEFGPQWDQSANDFDVTLSSGSGPYAASSFEGATLAVTRSANWWGATPALLDAIVFQRPANDQLAASYAAGTLDALDFPLTGDVIEALADTAPEDVRYEYPIDTPIQLAFAGGDDPENPFSDPRLGTAIGLSVDRFALIERLYAGDGRPSGPLPWYLEGWALPEEALLQQPGYRPNKDDDLTDINLLVDAAGGVEAIGEINMVVADLFEGFFPGVAQTLSAMVQQNAGLTLSTSFRSYGEITDRLREGALPAFFGWGPAPVQADPTDLWRRTAHSQGAENYGRYANPEVDALIEEMGTTFNLAARQRLAQQVQDLLLTTGFWRQNIANGIQLGIHKPYFHPEPRSHDFAWAGHHLAASWLDIEDEAYPSDRELPAVTLDAPLPTPAAPNPPAPNPAAPPTPPTPSDGG